MLISVFSRLILWCRQHVLAGSELLLALLLMLATGAVQAQRSSALGMAGVSAPSPTAQVQTEQVRAQLLAYAPQGITPGGQFWLGLQLEHAPHWHTYWQNSGDSGAPTQLQWTLPAGMAARSGVQWPLPVKIPVADLANYGYDGTVLLITTVDIAPDWAGAAPSVPVQLQASWLVCREECLPQQGQFVINLPTQPQTGHAALFEATLQALPRPLPAAPPVTDAARAATGASASTSAHANAQTNVQASAPARASAHAEGEHITLRISGLPTDWRGKMLNVYPVLPDIIQPAAEGTQGWQGADWHITLPQHPYRSASPDSLDVVLAVRGATDADGIQRNADGLPTYQIRAAITGSWSAPAAAAATPDILPDALAEALEQDKGGIQPSSMPFQQPSVDSGIGLWLAVTAALLGGLILNLMPCVFPVLAIKVLTFTQHAHSPTQQRISGLAYTAGVVISLLALASALLLLRAAGEQLGWGFQLQNPWLVAALAALFTALGLNLAGLFEISSLLPARLAQAQAQHPVADALLSGVLAVLVAAPCTAPFMGAALGYAVAQPAPQALLVFTALGLGLALPVLLGSLFPGLLRWLPRPGPWMDVMRKLMAFPMLGTVIWLVWVLGQQVGMHAVALLLAALLMAVGLGWSMLLARQYSARQAAMTATNAIITSTSAGTGMRWFYHLLWLLFAVLLALTLKGYVQEVRIYQAQQSDTPALSSASDGMDSSAANSARTQAWQPWSPQRVQQALAQGQPVLVDYTAAWCITCQVNKRLVLSRPEFLHAAQERNVLLLRADWTRHDPAITQSLNQIGRSGVPAYVLYSPSQPQSPRVLSELLTLSAMQQALATL